MTAFAVFGMYASQAAAAYRILTSAANAGAPCPSVEQMARDVGLTSEPMRKLLNRMEAEKLIHTTYPAKARRVVEIVASGKKTAPTTGCNEAAKAAGTGWPKRTMTPEQLSDAIGAAGRFEDEPAAKLDPGSDRREMPSPAMVFSGCGISQIYGIGGSQRSVAGMP
jgi:hypothetical protein